MEEIMKRKGIGGLTLVVIAAVAALALLMSGTAGTIYGMITSPKYCDDAPYEGNCFCAEDENKVMLLGYFSVPMGPKYTCETKDLKFNPESDTFHAETLAHAKNYLLEHFGDCDTIDCQDPAYMRIDGDLIYTPNARAVQYECTSTFGQAYWGTVFDIETGNMQTAYCNDFVETPGPQDKPMVLATDSGYLSQRYNLYKTALVMSSDCSTDNGKATTTISLSDGHAAESWALAGMGFSYCFEDRWYACKNGLPVQSQAADICSITSSDASTAEISCDAGCPTVGFSNYQEFVFAYLK